MDFTRVFRESGLNKTEIAVLYGVSRQTICNWGKGDGPRPDSYTERMARPITTALENAMDRGLLPLGPMFPSARRARITKMAGTLQNLKPAPPK